MTITRLHHVGHVVRDIARATTLFAWLRPASRAAA
ncbi:hypothetical protein SUDANB95_03763 [Actinosynnema sp. ALI-1.44]